MARSLNTYLRDWKDAWFQFNTLPDESKHMLEPIINRIYVELCKNTTTPTELIEFYFHNWQDGLKAGIRGFSLKKEDLDSEELHFVENVAYFRRYQDVRNNVTTSAK